MPPRRPRFVDTPARVASWRLVHAEADRAYPALATLWQAVFTDLRDVLTQDAMTAALASRNLAAVQALLARAWPQVAIGTARAPLLALLRQTVEATAKAVTPALRATLGVNVGVQFGVVSQEALVWIAQYAGAQIREIGQSTIEAVRDVLRRQFTEGVPRTQVMTELEALIGLTARQVRTIETLRATLATSGVAPGEVARQVEVAAARALRVRVEAISRTESLAAANAGNHALWKAAEQQGFLDPGRFKRFWILTPDSRLCPVCRQVPGLNSRGVGLNESFKTPIGNVSMPPAHPMCRCAVSLREVA